MWELPRLGLEPGELFKTPAIGTEAKEVEQGPSMKYQAKMLIQRLKETSREREFCFEELI